MLVMVWAGGVCLVQYWTQPPTLIWMKALGLGPHIPWVSVLTAFTWLGLLGIGAHAVGRWLLEKFPVPDLSRSERLIFSVALGSGLVGYAMLALGVVGGYFRWPVRLVVIGLAGWGGWRGWRHGPVAAAGSAERFPRLPMILMGLAWAVNLLGALGPETFYDALLYHLGVPQHYINEHRMVATPHLVFAPLPFMQEMLYALALLLQGDTLAKMISWSMGVGLSLATAALGRQLGYPAAGAWAAALVAGTPAVLFNGRVAGTECALSVWCLLMLWAIVRFLQTEQPGWLALGGTFGGLAAGTKYLGLPACLVLGIILLVAKRRVAPVVRFAVVAALVWLPWPVRTAWWSGGNPVHPYLATLEPQILPPGQRALWVAETQRSEIIHTGVDRLFHPWILTMKEEYSPNHLGPWLLAVVPVLLAAVRRWPRPEAICGSFTLGYWAAWATLTMSQRFLMPAFAPAALAAWLMIREATAGWLRRVAVGLALLVIVIGVNRAATGMGFEANWLVTMGQDTRDNFLSRPHGMYHGPSYAAIRWLNEHTPADARVVFLGETRGTYLERRFLAGSGFDWPPVTDWVATASDTEGVYQRARAAGVTHVLVNMGLGLRDGVFSRWRAPDRDAPLFEEFFLQHAAPRFWTPQGVGVFELVDQVPPGQRRPDVAAALAGRTR